MELVYLWVEDYKNIKRQGFNFSPRFKCEYDEESKELTIEEKKDYVRIFPDNINVTAIVGENGSGKSNLLELLALLYEHPYKDNQHLIIFHENKIYISSDILINNKTEYKTGERNKFSNRLEVHNQLIYFANDITTFFNKPEWSRARERNINALNDDNKVEMDDNRYISNIDKHVIRKYQLFSKRLKEVLFNDSNTFKTKNLDLKFTKFKREYHFYEMASVLVSIENIKELGLFPDDDNLILYKHFPFHPENTPSLLYKMIVLYNLYTNYIDSKHLNISEIIPKIKEKFCDDLNENVYSEILKILNENDYSSCITISEAKELVSRLNYTDNEIWEDKEFNFIDDNLNNEKESLLKEIERSNFYNDDSSIDFFSLSSGEREYISLLTHFIYHLIQYNPNKTFIMDEPDISLHPNWQKKLISDFVYCIDKYNKGNIFNLIITSHSPFILSDIPKENVVFLEKGKQVYPFENAQTFGANIHTLLSHGFFMKDGLMGEFAKSKIDTAIKYLNQTKLSNDETTYCKNIISIIGEPIIKRQLQKILDSKRLSEIDVIKKQIEQLQKELATKENKK